MPNCIYCNAADANSISHIIPESLGNKTTLDHGVCGDCNLAFNREVEEPIVKELSPIRSFLQLGGKRRELPRVRIEVRYGTGRQIVTAKSSADLLSKVFVFKAFTDPHGVWRNIAFISLDRDAIEQHRRRWRDRNPDEPLTDIPALKVEDLQFWAQFDFDVFADHRCLRMIGKIAFEWWCRERNAELLSSDEYNEIRNFVRYGIDPGFSIVSVVGNAAITGYFNRIPFGVHLLYRRTHPQLSSLVMIVAPYGLVYYKVVLARRYQAIGPEILLTGVNPQTGESYTPRLVHPQGTILTLRHNANAVNADARDVIRPLAPALLDRLNNGMRAIIDQSQRNPVGNESG